MRPQAPPSDTCVGRALTSGALFSSRKPQGWMRGLPQVPLNSKCLHPSGPVTASPAGARPGLSSGGLHCPVPSAGAWALSDGWTGQPVTTGPLGGRLCRTLADLMTAQHCGQERCQESDLTGRAGPKCPPGQVVGSPPAYNCLSESLSEPPGSPTTVPVHLG